MTGKVMKKILSEPETRETVQLLLKAKVFARMSPDEKAMLVQFLQKHTPENVIMCGDGANDCAALKTADAGVSLADSEASIAAPFSSKI